jgi:signal transduction histidine kinase
MLVQLAQIAAVAVENARLFAAEQHALHIAETLRAANIALTQLFNLDTVLETLLDYLAQLVPYDSANVMLIEDGSRVVLRARRGYERWTDPTRLEGLTLDTETTPTLRTLIQTRQSLIIADTQQYAGWQPLPETAHIRSWMGVPLTAAGEVIGLYAVDKAVPDFFTPDHLRSAETLAAQAAVAIENALLFEQVRAGRERLRQLAQQVIAAQEEERQRLSRELHDQVGQNLTALLLTLNALEENHPAPPEAERLLNHTRGLADQMLRDLHRLAWELRPAALDDLGLETALRQYAEDSTQRAGLRLDFHCHGLRDRRLPPHVETTLYRVVQEALTNVVRHARASRVSVLLGADADRARAIVEDDGQGFEVEAALNTPRLGLLGMEERVALVNGALTIEASPGAGTTVYVNVPLGH